jgi:tRNA(Ile)-lysidine synthase|uniref:tRNA(Ile)-lysidine synthase n=1 Tax=Thorea hispida TaxID=202687 RepID=A0A1C9CAG4_9FLOR|nr:tRNA(Ile)-lysidine synthase [Thorea hispida]AOM65382.1 tRNA(Ile)-lysidine synthase [Thorea hispida]UNJ79049.1 tRNA(Ile)-lysidine synthase [Thorea hispida]
MYSFLHQKFITNLKKSLTKITGASILLAISGGQDSLCILKLFLDLYNQYKFQLGVINIDHSWRYDSTKNTYHIINILSNSKIPVYIYKISCTDISELKSRILRYQILLKTASTYNYTIIVTAHSLSDQVETCLYNLLKGTSNDGLNSLRWKRQLNSKIQVLRPILNFTRYEIAWFCKFFSLPYWSDISNYNYETQRNRIRQELIPYLQLYFNSKIETNLCRFLDNNHKDCEYLKQNTIKIYQKIKHRELIAINYKQLIQQHSAIQHRVLYFFFLYNLNDTVSSYTLKTILNHLKKKSSVNLKYKRLKIRNSNEWLYISKI